MREIAEIELAIQGGTEKIETLGEYSFFLVVYPLLIFLRRTGTNRGVDARVGCD
jgi:hypothetical protein